MLAVPVVYVHASRCRNYGIFILNLLIKEVL